MKIILYVIVFFGLQKTYAGVAQSFDDLGVEASESSSGDHSDGPVSNCSGCAHC